MRLIVKVSVMLLPIFGAHCQRVGFFAPQYALLDPMTGRPVEQKFEPVSLESRSGRSINGGFSRSSRQVDRNQHYLSPFGDVLSDRETPRFSRPNRQIEVETTLPNFETLQDAENQNGFSSPLEGPNSFQSLARFPSFGSNIFVIRQNNFQSSKKKGGNKNERTRNQSFNFGEETESTSYKRPSRSHSVLPLATDFLADPSYESLNTAEAWNGNQPAYKWRKRHPIYGRRKKRSAEQQGENRRQSTWVLLDPITGRTRNNPFPSRSQFFNLHSNEIEDSAPIKHRLTRFSTSKRRPEFRSQTRELDYFPSSHQNSSRNPVYKHYKRYPYSG